MSDTEAAYLRRTLSGAQYVEYINSLESDRRARTAFQSLVLETAPPDGSLFDFGAGPGIDARFFAEHGFTVTAYDVDPRMRAYFAEYCRDFIDSGRISLVEGGYRDFMSSDSDDTAAGRADVIISDFAPLNLVDDLAELFAKFHRLTRPGGKVIASVLNPCFISEMRSRWWWRTVPQLLRAGEIFMPGPQAPHYRRRAKYFEKVSAPYFRLTRVFAGLPPTPRGRWGWLQATRAQYLFLLFEK